MRRRAGRGKDTLMTHDRESDTRQGDQRRRQGKEIRAKQSERDRAGAQGGRGLGCLLPLLPGTLCEQWSEGVGSAAGLVERKD